MVPIARHLYKPDWAAALLLSRGVTVARQIFIFIPIHPKPPSDPPPPAHSQLIYLFFIFYDIYFWGWYFVCPGSANFCASNTSASWILSADCRGV